MRADPQHQFLVGGGTMGALMRAKDWALTPLGAAAFWPQSLRTAVSTCLNCSFPILVWWGPNFVKLYNDAYAAIIADKHPAALGAAGRDIWPEVWDEVGPMLNQVLNRGEAIAAQDMKLHLDRRGFLEESYFSFSYSPIRDETGNIGGVFCPVVETTERVFGERRSAFLLELNNRLRDAPDPLAVKTEACALLGQHLGVGQVGYAETQPDPAGDGVRRVLVEGDWNNGSVPSTNGLHQLNDFGLEMFNTLRENRTVAVHDVASDPRTSTQAAQARLAAMSMQAFLDVPLVKAGRLVAYLFAADAAPHRWTERQSALMREVAERIWAAAERTRAEAALRASEARWRTFFANMHEGFAHCEMVYAADGRPSNFRYLDVNKSFERLTGITSVVGRLASETMPDGWRERMNAYAAVVETGTPGRFEFQIAAIDRWFEVFAYRTEPGRFGALFLSVTQRRRTEAALRDSQARLEARVVAEVQAREAVQAQLAHGQRMEALGQLAGGIAHDFNNVLQAVGGGLSLIQKRAASPDDVRKIARMAADAADRGAAVTARLLAFARKGELRAVPVDVVSLLQNLREMLAPTLGAGITIQIDADPLAPPLLADKAQLETVMVNLAVNARDAMPDGGILTLSAHADTVTAAAPDPAGLPPGAYLRLVMTDTGMGMDPAVLARASEPFFTTKGPGQGTGLGLAMARGFAQQSGGGLTISSVPGRGTSVTVSLPQVQRTALDNVSPPAATAPIGPLGAARVLLVDDDTMVRDVMAHQLTELGYTVEEATSGLAALARLDSGVTVDLMVTDFAMPGMNGLVLTQQARRRRPLLPVVLLTGYADTALQHDIADMPDTATILLRKPVSGDALAQHVATLLARMRAAAAD